MDVLELLKENEQKDLLRFVTAGSVDDGKSTLIGRLLFESKGIYEDQLEAVKTASGKKGSALEDLDLALVTDGLKAEREQGITIDVAYRYFSTPRRKFIIADTPGHEQYTRNMATGASTASLSVILIDATLGMLTQSKRHAFIAALLGIPHVVVTVNKMDLVDYSEAVFRRICDDFRKFAARLEVHDITFIPVSALNGDNIVTRSKNMDWYQGTTLLNHLEEVHIAGDRNLIDMRFPVQYVSRDNPDFRGYMGTVASGILRPGDEVVVLPSGVRSRIGSILGVDGELEEAFPPLAATVTLQDDVDVSRGDMMVHVNNMPRVANTFEAMIVWMATEPLQPHKGYLIKQTTRTTPAQISALRYKVDVDTLHRQPAETLQLNEIGRAALTTSRPLCFDPYNKNRSVGAFIIVDRVTDNTVGAGMILDRIPKELLHAGGRWEATAQSAHVTPHNSLVQRTERRARLGHKAFTVWLTGLTGSGKTQTAYGLERRLFDSGINALVIDGENARLGFSSDLDFSAQSRSENIRRAAEVARMVNEAGLVAICAFLSPYALDRRKVRQAVGPDRFVEVYLSAPRDVCRRRRPELYAKAESGEIAHFSGVTAPYEPPSDPELVLATHELDSATSIERILARLRELDLIDGPGAGR
jgi:bifunctional enzyme CysN/CysC